jgi:homoserine O-acetyltransferase
MDYFDPFADEKVAISRLREVDTRFLVVSFDTDWRFPTPHSAEIARVLERAEIDVTHEEVASPWGHDSFLLEVPRYHELVATQLATISVAT